MSRTLLVEVVSEEIPAGYIRPALEAMSSLMHEKLLRQRIEHGRIETFETPRRLAVIVHDVAERQGSVTEEVIGPPRAAAYDAAGRPTKAAEGFAKSRGVTVSRLSIKATAKGDYVCVKKHQRGRATRKILQSVIPEVIVAIPFPKSMRWADSDLTFARPIHSVVALMGDQIIPFRLESIKSGRSTAGHRFMCPKGISIANATEYVSSLKSAFVVADVQERRRMIEQGIAEAARKMGGEAIRDDELLDTVCHLVEHCTVSAGRFDEKFLKLPKEVLITAMREHQKYFAVAGPNGQLRPRFIAVNNTAARDIRLVTAGHERVLRARLEDARFFFESDLKTSLEVMVERLNGVLFQAQLGTMFEKVSRVQKVAERIADLVAPDLKADVSSAARLCKADLTTHMVYEFPRLQGVMGRVYAARAGEPATVAQAIEEHYLPAYAGGPLPETVGGAIVSMADKFDTICGCFGIGLIPSGTSDPYALRRQAIGIIQIMLEKGFGFSLPLMVEESLKLYKGRVSSDTVETAGNVLTFFRHRMEHVLAEEGFARDLIAAVLSSSMDDIPAVKSRVEALQALKAKPDFQPLAVAFKRVANIIKQAEQKGEIASGRGGAGERVDPGLFGDACERDLYEAFQRVSAETTADVEQGDLDKALRGVATLKGPVDAFFDGVMVMAEDKRLKENRLALLAGIADLFSVFADFSKIST